VELLKRQS